ncbi:MAG: methyl-accepting chemotaxis protein [Desulfobulbaceae bacterium]|jgi:methyl-accepting chemotaxis protein|nr:methyl-accepting chemotaxis protein [Desulfobulbaceae bacterium]
MEKYKRRTFFIKKDLQGRQVLGFFLFFAGGCLLFVALFLLFSADSMTISYDNHNLQFGQTPLMLLKEVLASSWIVVVIGGGLLVYAAVRFTHRVAGPVFRFEKAFDNMNAGRLDDRIYLRAKDEGKELADKINAFNDTLSETVGGIRRGATAVDELLNQLETSVFPEGQNEEARSLLWSLREQNRRIIEYCAKYTVKDA